ncbi:hypothetical protein ACFQ9X_04125 [Catenulispora yoronensis]
MGVGAVAVSGNEDRRTARMTGANFVTVTLLPTSAHPERDLAELGAPAWLADYAGAPPWCAPTALQNGAAYKQFTKKLSHKQIMRFFLNHPGRLLPVLDRVAGYFYVPRATATLCQQTPAGKRMMVTPLLANYTKIGHTPRGCSIGGGRRSPTRSSRCAGAGWGRWWCCGRCRWEPWWGPGGEGECAEWEPWWGWW